MNRAPAHWAVQPGPASKRPEMSLPEAAGSWYQLVLLHPEKSPSPKLGLSTSDVLSQALGDVGSPKLFEDPLVLQQKELLEGTMIRICSSPVSVWFLMTRLHFQVKLLSHA